MEHAYNFEKHTLFLKDSASQ
jgi:hypothetical protein